MHEASNSAFENYCFEKESYWARKYGWRSWLLYALQWNPSTALGPTGWSLVMKERTVVLHFLWDKHSYWIVSVPLLETSEKPMRVHWWEGRLGWPLICSCFEWCVIPVPHFIKICLWCFSGPCPSGVGPDSVPPATSLLPYSSSSLSPLPFSVRSVLPFP